MADCIFCKMVAREIDTEVVYESDSVFAFRDVNPQAPVHVLVIPKRHVATLDELSDDDTPIAGELMLAASEIARQEGLTADGYRVVSNCGEHGGQSVFHIHLHVLGGRQMRWPPG